MWVHRRSEEPAPTEVECYWRKSRLASVARSSTCIKVSDFRDITLSDVDSASSDLFLSRVVSQGITNKSDGEIFKLYCEVPKLFKILKRLKRTKCTKRTNKDEKGRNGQKRTTRMKKTIKDEKE
mgnify:CR=1 FL=1